MISLPDLDLGDRASRLAWTLARGTAPVRQGRSGALGAVGHFAQILHFGDKTLAFSTDGVGTKVEVAERMGRYDTLGYDLVAMAADDLLCVGAEPTNLVNAMDVDRIDEATVGALMGGLAAAAREEGLALAGGEIAELGARVTGYGRGMHLNWTAAALGEVVCAPEGARPGDAVLVLREAGLRANGFTLARQILSAAVGEDWHNADFQGERWGDLLLTPARLYAPVITAMWREGLQPRALAHLTGGGLPGNLPRVLGGFGADLPDLFAAPPWITELARLGSVSAAAAYRHWNCGQGMAVVLAPEEVAAAIGTCDQRGVDAQIAGVITAEPGLALPGGLRFP